MPTGKTMRIPCNPKPSDPSSCVVLKPRQDLSSGDCNVLYPGQRCVHVYELVNTCKFPVKVTECRLFIGSLLQLVDEQGIPRSDVDIELGYGYLRKRHIPGLGPIGYMGRLSTSLSLVPIGLINPVVYPNRIIPDKYGYTWFVAAGVILRPEATKPLKGPVNTDVACRAVKTV